MGDSMPFISIVIPVRNESRHIESVLSALVEQDYPKEKIEIIVCDGRSDDETVPIADRFAANSPIKQRTLTNPAMRSSGGRNVGLRAARGDIVCFIDGHCRIGSNGMLAAVAKLMADQDLHCIARPQRLYADTEGFFQRAVVLARASRLGHAADSTIYEQHFVERVCDPASAGAIYRRSVFDVVGPYDETFDACEDVELNVRVRQAGLKAVLTSAAEIFYVARNSPQALFKQMARYGTGRMRLMRKHASERSMKVFVPLAIFTFIALTPVVDLALPWPVARGWSTIVGLYVLTLFSAGFFAAAKEKASSFSAKVRLGAAVAFALLVIHVGLGWGELRGLLTSRDSTPPA